MSLSPVEPLDASAVCRFNRRPARREEGTSSYFADATKTFDTPLTPRVMVPNVAGGVSSPMM